MCGVLTCGGIPKGRDSRMVLVPLPARHYSGVLQGLPRSSVTATAYRHEQQVADGEFHGKLFRRITQLGNAF